MSAFVGLVALDGAPASLPLASSMLGRLKHRVDEAGWNARHLQARESVALGCASLDSLPQARFEREQPEEAFSLLTDRGALWLAGDVRLDGRDELVARLELDSDQASQWSDGRLVLETYARFGEEAPRELHGDFAFAIWDEGASRLFCARDRFGVRPFYFAFVPGQVFACANEIKALWPALPFAPRPDEAHIGEYLTGDTTSFSRTFYEGIERLPPAHTLVVDLRSLREAPRQNRYFALDGTSELVLDSDEDYALRLRGAFERAVRERARAAGRLAAFLSGGLDSSSVVAVAAREAPDKHPMLALSTVFARFSSCDERQWIEPNLARAGAALEREWVWGDDIGALHDMERVVWHLDGPPIGPNTCSTWMQYPPLRKAGARVVLDGHGGDEVVFMGYERIAELIGQRRFREARRELVLLRRHGLTDVSATPLLWAGLARKARGTRFVGRLMRLVSARLQARSDSRRAPAEPEQRMAILREVVREEKHSQLIAAQPEASEKERASVREHHVQGLEGALQPLALEAMDAMAGAHAMEVRVPFWEEQLVQLCLSFPSDQKLRDGWNRWVMRRAMDGLLPPQVQWRRAKTNFAPHMIFGLHSLEKERVEACLDQPGALAQWMDVERARALWVELPTLPADSMRAAHIAFTLWRLMALGAWLNGLNTKRADNASVDPQKR